MQDFRKLRVWESSVDLTAHVYQVTGTFPSPSDTPAGPLR